MNPKDKLCDSRLFSALFLLSHFKCDSSFCHVRPTSVTCFSLSSPTMVPYVCQNVYVVCFFQPDSFPCFLSNEPRSPRGSEPKPHAIYTDRTAGALPAKAVRDEEVEGWVEKLTWKLQVNPSVGNVSLFTLFFPLSSSSPSVSFSQGCPRIGQVRSCTDHISCTAQQTSLAHYDVVFCCCRSSVTPFTCVFHFYAADVVPP